MDITLSKKWRIPAVLLFIAFWLLFFVGGLILVVYWIPELVVYMYNTIVHGLSSLNGLHWLHYILVPWNALTWALAVALLIWTGVYQFNTVTSTVKSTKKNMVIRFK